ncbi:hypothetical protein [Polyangium sp. 15x6]|uniref:hypothetical protein n=1 Tax=Polyangium sp. 15x6 TaxID=3042687 RepID=UPI00249B7A4D|nr:hypothetical protein [Polyangium sp. 15x6]MDI3282102.1 hypothetical protein [Polyangium sp. 15x6]
MDIWAFLNANIKELGVFGSIVILIGYSIKKAMEALLPKVAQAYIDKKAKETALIEATTATMIKIPDMMSGIRDSMREAITGSETRFSADLAQTEGRISAKIDNAVAALKEDIFDKRIDKIDSRVAKIARNGTLPGVGMDEDTPPPVSVPPRGVRKQ